MSRLLSRLAAVCGAALFLTLGAGGLTPHDAAAARGGGGGGRGGGTHTNVNRNVNQNVNVNRNVNRNVNVDVDRGYHGGGYHPVGTAVAVGVTAGVTAAAIGSIAYSLPPSCQAVMINGVTYQQCGSSWYQPRYSGTQVNYVVVNPPR